METKAIRNCCVGQLQSSKGPTKTSEYCANTAKRFQIHRIFPQNHLKINRGNISPNK